MTIKIYRDDIAMHESIKNFNKILHLEKYCNTVETMLHHIKVFNRHNNYEIKLKKNVDTKVINLYHRLCENSCRINYLHRIQHNNGKYEITKEDITTALEQIKNLLHFEQPKILVSYKSLRFYDWIQEHYNDKEFGVREIWLKQKEKSRRTVQYYLKELYEQGLVEMTYHHPRCGHKYKIKQND